MNTKTVTVTLSNDQTKVFNDVTMVDLRDNTIFTVKYRSEEGKAMMAMFNRPIDIQPDVPYAKSLSIEFIP